MKVSQKTTTTTGEERMSEERYEGKEERIREIGDGIEGDAENQRL